MIRFTGPSSGRDRGFTNRKAEEMRLKAYYRRIAMLGNMGASIEALRRLVGPDSAYHLYGGFGRSGK